jgi:hypothetical protein
VTAGAEEKKLEAAAERAAASAERTESAARKAVKAFELHQEK